MSKKICAITTVEITQSNFMIPAMSRLKQNGWEVTLVCNMSPEFMMRYQDEFNLINIPCHRGISIPDLLIMPFRLARLFKKEKFDIVQYATPNASLYASLGSKFAGVRHRVYCQWGIRYVGSRGIMRSVLRLLEKLTCANSTAIRPASKKNMEFAIADGLYKADKARVIGDGGSVGIDLAQFDLNKKNILREQVYAEYPQLKDKTVFAFVGRLNVDKGVFELLDAFAKLQNKYSRIALLLIGNFDGDLPIRLHGIRNNPDIIITGWIEDVPKYISAADVMVLPSYREGFSMVIQQAMAMAIPVITTDIPGPSEVIENGISGLLVQPKSTESLFDAMNWTISHSKQCQMMGASGRLRCETLFSRDRMLGLTLLDREDILKSGPVDKK